MLPNKKVIIAGCGLSGMITALAFAKCNIPSVIIEHRFASEKDFFSDIRTTALTAHSKNFFENVGVWEELSKFAGNFNDIYVADNSSSDMIHLSSSTLSDSKKMGYLLQNEDFKKCLFSLTSSSDKIKIIDSTKYEVIQNTELGCDIKLGNGEKYHADLLIACDGRSSEIKSRYFSSDVEKSYDQHAITFLVHHEKKHEGTAVEHFMPSGPFAILPLLDQNISSVVWTIKSEQKDVMMNLPKDEFTYLIQQNFGEFLGKITIKSEVAAFPLKAYSTKKYYNKRVALIADTAHIVHPLAGQGLNQGIKDIEILSKLIHEYGINDYALGEYESLRKPDNNDMFELTDAINTVFSNDSKMLYAVRQIGFNVIENFAPLKDMLIEYAMGRR
ncbi:FAD-dependent monooxygenase [Rickettsiaceae bacterium]|nr:FAD-dependent monooxygenase [Rickettsiaceae bacterium]